MNTKGYINSRVTYPTGVLNPSCNKEKTKCLLYNVVKGYSPENAGENYSQGSHIEKIKKKNASCLVLKCNSGVDYCTNRQCKSASYHIGGKKFYITPYSKNYNPLPMESSMYNYSGLMTKTNLPTPDCKSPFPVFLSHNKGTCQINIDSSQKAIKLGLLPSDWMNGKLCVDPSRVFCIDS